MVSDARAADALNHGADTPPATAPAYPGFAASAGDWRIAALIFGCSLLLLVISMGRGVQVYDEALVLVGATRVADGAIPHRDFYTPYGPAQFYVLAGLFKLFGPSVLVERAWDSMVRAGIVTVAFLVVRRTASRRDAWIAAAVILLWLRAVENYAYPVFPSLLFALIAVLCVSPIFAGRGSRSLLFAGGFCVGIAVLFRFDSGAYAFAAVTFVLAAYALSKPQPLQKRIDQVIEILAPCWLGVAVVCVPVALAFAANGVLHDFYFDIIYFPANYYRRMRAWPLPSLFQTLTTPFKMGVYLPFATWIAALIAVATVRRPTSASDRQDGWAWIMLLLGALSALFYFPGLVRAERAHMTLSVVPALMLAAALLPYTKAKLGGTFPLGRIVVILLWLFFVADLTLLSVVTVGRPVAHNLKWSLRPFQRTDGDDYAGMRSGSCRPTSGLERMVCFEDHFLARLDAARYIEANSLREDRIFVGYQRHDRLSVNDILIYFECARRPATKWYQFDPGLQTSEAIQRETVRELQSVKPRYVLLYPAEDFSEPNESSISTGVTLLDDFIRSNYRETKKFGIISVRRINDVHLSD